MDDKKDEKKNTNSADEGSKVGGIVQTYKAEFRKIVWPSKDALIKHTVTVIAVSLMFGAFIALNDYAFGHVFRAFVGWIS